MDLTQRFLFRQLIRIGGEIESERREFLNGSKHNRTERSLADSFGERIDRHNPTHVNVLLPFLLNNLKLGMIQIDPIFVPLRTAKHDQLLARCQHALQIMLIKPPADHTAAQNVIESVLQRRLDDFPASEKARGYLLDNSTQTDWLFGTVGWERSKSRAVLVAPWIMLQQVSPGHNPKSLDQFSLRFRYPSELFKPLIQCVRCSPFTVHRSPFTVCRSLKSHIPARYRSGVLLRPGAAVSPGFGNDSLPGRTLCPRAGPVGQIVHR